MTTFFRERLHPTIHLSFHLTMHLLLMRLSRNMTQPPSPRRGWVVADCLAPS